MKKLLPLLGFAMAGLIPASPVLAQKAYVLPSPTDANAAVTLFIDVNQCEDGVQNSGLGAILDAFPDTAVYIWTWQPSDPAAGNGNWDNSAAHQKMTKVGPKLYSITFVPTAYYGVDGPALFSRGISCLAKLQNGGAIPGFNGEAKTEDIHIDIVPQLCSARMCVFPELRAPSDFVSITYDNAKELAYPGLQNMGDEECYLYILGKVGDFTSYEVAPLNAVLNTPALRMKKLPDGNKFRLTFIPEDLFADQLQPGEQVEQIWYYVVRSCHTYPPGPPPFEIISLLDCQ